MAWLGRVVVTGAIVGGGLLVTPLVAPDAPAVLEPIVAVADTAPDTAPAPTTTAPPATTTTTAAAPPVAVTTTITVVPAPPPPPLPPAPTTPAEKGAAALARIDYPWERLGWTVRFEGNNPGLLGEARCATNEIFVYVRPSQTVANVAFVTAFELGHAVDCGTMTDARREEWAAIRGFAPGWTWFPGCLCAEDDYGSGDISMVFASWLVPDGGYGWRSNLAPPPGPAELQRLLPYLRPAAVA